MMPSFGIFDLLLLGFVILVGKVAYDYGEAKEHVKRSAEESKRFAEKFLSEDKS